MYSKHVAYGSIIQEPPDVRFSGETNDLPEVISSAIHTLNSNSQTLQQSLKLIGTTKDSEALRDKIQNTLASTKDTVKQITANLQMLKRRVKRGDKVQKLNVQMITESFEESLKMGMKIQELVVAKMRTHMLPSELALLEQNRSIQDSEDRPLTTTELMKRTENLEFVHGMLLEREQRMNKIAQSVIDVHQIMKEIGAQVHEQGEGIDSIENAIEDVHTNVEQAHGQLEQASHYHASNRRKICMILSILILAGVILVIITAVSNYLGRAS